MRWLWLLLSQAVTLGVAAALVLAFFHPETLPWPRPTAMVMLGGATTDASVERRDGLPSYSPAAAVAMPSVVSVYTTRGSPGRPSGVPVPFRAPGDESGAGLGSGVVVSADGYVLTRSRRPPGTEADASEPRLLVGQRS